MADRLGMPYIGVHSDPSEQSKLSPRECAGSVEITRILFLGRSLARYMAVAAADVVFPVPPFPPKMINRNFLLLRKLGDFFVEPARRITPILSGTVNKSCRATVVSTSFELLLLSISSDISISIG